MIMEGNRQGIVVIAVLCLLFLSPSPSRAHEGRAVHPFVVSGVVINSDAARLTGELAAILGEAAGYPLKVRFVDSYEALSEVLREDRFAIGWTCGAPFVEDHEKDGQQLVAVPLLHGQPLYHSLVIARSGRPERRLADFRGQVLAYSDPRSNSGFVVPAYELRQAGFDIHAHFRLLLHTGNHERSIEAVNSGLADVAAVDEYVWLEYIKRHPGISREVRVIQRFGPYPFTPIVAGSGVDENIVARLQGVLTSLDSRREGRRLLREFGLDGFVLEKPDFYRPIADMLDELGRHRMEAP